LLTSALSADVDVAPLAEPRRAVQAIVDELATMGGDERARARELDLVRYQVAEIEGAALSGPEENEALEVEEDALADATAHREAAALALAALSGDGETGAAEGAVSAADAVGAAVAAVARRGPFRDGA